MTDNADGMFMAEVQVAIEQYLQSGERLGGHPDTGDAFYIEFLTVKVRPDTDGLIVEVLFRDLSRPECTFGYREAIAQQTLARQLDPDQVAVPIVLALEEILDSDDMRLPTICHSGSITWVR